MSKDVLFVSSDIAHITKTQCIYLPHISLEVGLLFSGQLLNIRPHSPYFHSPQCHIQTSQHAVVENNSPLFRARNSSPEFDWLPLESNWLTLPPMPTFKPVTGKKHQVPWSITDRHPQLLVLKVSSYVATVGLELAMYLCLLSAAILGSVSPGLALFSFSSNVLLLP